LNSFKINSNKLWNWISWYSCSNTRNYRITWFCTWYRILRWIKWKWWNNRWWINLLIYRIINNKIYFSLLLCRKVW